VPSDIKQGALGNCYYLATLAAIAENPQRIKDMFIDDEANDAGCYVIKFYVNGVQTAVMVDDWIPCQYGRPAFAKSSTEGELWVILLEKAWAKLQGSYMRTVSGTSDTACSHLLGIYAKYHFHKNSEMDDLWKMFIEGERRNFVMMASS